MRLQKESRNKRKLIVVAILALAFTVMQIVGYQISMIYNTTVHQSVFFQQIGVLSGGQCICLALVEFPIWCLLLGVLYKILEGRSAIEKDFSDKELFGWWIVSTIIIFSGWIPCLRAAYPGFYNYDVFAQIPSVLYEEVPYSAHHPLLHTLLMGKIMQFGYLRGEDLNDGIILYCVFQMIVCAVIFGGMVYYIVKHTKSRLPGVLAVCYYAFFPTIAMFSMSTTKDVLFSALLVCTLVFLYEMCVDFSGFWKSKYKIVRFVLVAVLACLFRKNGIYAVICLIPVMMWTYKKYWRSILLLLVSVVLLYFVCNKALMVATDATEGSSEEAFSVPMQQIARVYYDYGEEAFTSEELRLIEAGIPLDSVRNYNPFLSDLIKNYFDFNVVLENKTDYLMLWVHKGLQYPGAYIKAFLDNTYQAWYPGTSIVSDADEGCTYYFDMSMHAGGYRDSKDLELLEFYNEIALGYSYQKWPIVRGLFSIGAMFWVALFALGYAVYCKNKALLTIMLMIMFYCLTVFMGPISLVRYYLVLFYGFPVILGYLWRKQKSEKAGLCV